MYRILLTVSGDKNAPTDSIVKSIMSLPRDPRDVEVILLNVFEEFEIADERQVSSKDVYNEKDLPDTAQEVQTVLEKARFSVSVRREHGDPTGKILATAESLDVDIIAMGARKRSAVRRAVFGSVSEEVILNANRPVLVATFSEV